jgi:hypothetical protein
MAGWTRNPGSADSPDEPEVAAETDALGRSRAELVRGMPAELLATELERRGWIVIPPV